MSEWTPGGRLHSQQVQVEVANAIQRKRFEVETVGRPSLDCERLRAVPAQPEVASGSHAHGKARVCIGQSFVGREFQFKVLEGSSLHVLVGYPAIWIGAIHYGPFSTLSWAATLPGVHDAVKALLVSVGCTPETVPGNAGLIDGAAERLRGQVRATGSARAEERRAKIAVPRAGLRPISFEPGVRWISIRSID